jgi:hypothetical protein
VPPRAVVDGASAVGAEDPLFFGDVALPGP